MDADRLPVIIGVAQRCWREADAGRTPLDGLHEASSAALEDCGSPRRVRAALDAIAHVPFILTQEPALAPLMPRNCAAALAGRLGVDAAAYSAVAGGNLPQELLNRLATKLVKGEHRVALVAGAEMLNTLFGCLRDGAAPPDWSTGRDDAPLLLSEAPDAFTSGPEYAHGLREPIAAYPLFETALRHAEGLTIAEHEQRLGRLISAMSEVAAANPLAWRRERISPQAAVSTAGGNRLICYPYTRVMNAVIRVDMAACAIMTTAATARELGVPTEQWVYLHGSADTHDTWFLSERASLCRSPALEAAAAAALSQAGRHLDDIGLFDLYSCFPSAVQVACAAIGLDLDDPRGVTVTGGLTLFGGPGNNYSLHAIAEMVRRLRQARDTAGLVTANGAYLTKHSVGVYAAQPPREAWQLPDNAGLQARLDALPHPTVVEHASGTLTIDAYTVRYKAGEPQQGIVLGRLDNGARCLAFSAPDRATLARLISEDCVGVSGRVRPDGEANRFSF